MEDDKESLVEIQNEPADTSLGAVSQVVPDDMEQTKKPVEKPDDKPKEIPRPSQDISKLNSTIAYQTRQLEKAMRELNEMRQELRSRPQPVQGNVVPQTQDEIDDLAVRDWKAGVRKVVEKDIETKVQEILSKREEAILAVQKRTALEGELERSKQRVLQKYPGIEDSGTEESKLYREVINEDNSILSNIHGPEIAMYRMEEKMRQAGIVPQSARPAVDREAQRLARAGISSVVGRQASPGGKISLSKEQKEFCDHYNIPYEQYAKNLKSQSALGGVEA